MYLTIYLYYTIISIYNFHYNISCIYILLIYTSFSFLKHLIRMIKIRIFGWTNSLRSCMKCLNKYVELMHNNLLFYIFTNIAGQNL